MVSRVRFNRPFSHKVLTAREQRAVSNAAASAKAVPVKAGCILAIARMRHSRRVILKRPSHKRMKIGLPADQARYSWNIIMAGSVGAGAALAGVEEDGEGLTIKGPLALKILD